MIDTETDDEELYFTPSSSTNLASLFNTTMLPLNQNKEATLTYKPLKQPNVNPDQNNVTKDTDTKYPSSVIIFKEVHTFQMKNNEHLPFGKCGLALVGNEQVQIYQLLIYKQKDNIISTTKPTSTLELFIKPNNYIALMDDKKLTWAIHFYNESDLTEFMNILSDKCKCKIINHIHSNIKQDNKETLNEYKSNEPKPPTETESSLQFNDEKGETDRNMPSIKSSGDTNINEKINVDDVKPSGKPEIPNKHIFNDLIDMPQKNDSDTSDSSEATKKANILTRVAKMGKKLFTNERIDLTDSSDEDEKNYPKTEIKNKKIKSPKHNLNEKPHSISLAETQNQTGDKHSQATLIKNRIQSPAQIMVPYKENTQKLMCSPTYLPNDQLNLLFLENRTQGSELKMDIMKLQNGLDEVLNIVKSTNNSKRSISTQTDNTEIDNLITENKKLSQKICKLTESISSLKNDNDALKDKNDELLRNSTERAYEIANLTEKNVKSSCDIQLLNLKIKDHQTEIDSLKTGISLYKDKTEDCVVIKKSKIAKCEGNVKQLMNVLFAEACGNFSEDIKYDGATVKKLIAQTIIHNTFTVIKTVKETFNES